VSSKLYADYLGKCTIVTQQQESLTEFERQNKEMQAKFTQAQYGAESAWVRELLLRAAPAFPKLQTAKQQLEAVRSNGRPRPCSLYHRSTKRSCKLRSRTSRECTSTERKSRRRECAGENSSLQQDHDVIRYASLSEQHCNKSGR
jgi:hypothetical protein